MIQNNSESKADKIELYEVNQRLSNRLDLKAESSEVDRIPSLIQESSDKQTIDTKDSLASRFNSTETNLLAELDRKVSINDLH